jgi:hypothetical protein
MEFGRIVVAAAVLSIFAVGGLAAFQMAESAQQAAPDQNQTAVNETIAQEFDAYQFVDAGTATYTTGFNNTTTVYNATSGEEFNRGTDYKWNQSDGTVLFLDTVNTSENHSALITYHYTRNTAAVRETGGPLTAITEAFGGVAFLAAGLSLAVVLLVVAVIVARRIGSNNLPTSNR